MKNQAFKQVLKEFKFSEKETEIYLTLVGLGTSAVSNIAKYADINRSTTYVILGSLAKRGLVSIAEHRGIKKFTPTSPEKLIKDLEKTAEQYVKLASTAKDLLPKIKAKKAGAVSKSNVQLFEGAEGMKTVYEDALSSLETIRAYAFNKNTALQTAQVPAEYYNRLAKKNVNMRIMYPDSAEAKEFMARGEPSNAVHGNFVPDVSIYDNKIVIMSPEQNVATIIENKELANALKKAFDLSWKETQQRGKKGFFASAKGVV